MPIPSLNADGLLPPGIHDATLDEIRVRFGAFQQSDQRPRLLAKLIELVNAMQSSALFESLLIDGSFATDKLRPNDIDILAALRRGHDFQRDLPMSQYALVSRALLRRRFGLDVVVAELQSVVYKTYAEFFSRVRDRPDLKKGLLRLML